MSLTFRCNGRPLSLRLLQDRHEQCPSDTSANRPYSVNASLRMGHALLPRPSSGWPSSGACEAMVGRVSPKPPPLHEAKMPALFSWFGRALARRPRQSVAPRPCGQFGEPSLPCRAQDIYSARAKRWEERLRLDVSQGKVAEPSRLRANKTRLRQGYGEADCPRSQGHSL